MSKWTSEEVREKAHAYSLRGDSRTAAMLDTLSERIAADEAAVDEDRTCETCGGLGTIDETLGGIPTSNPKAECPDCDGVGEYTKGFINPPAQPPIDLAAIRGVIEVLEDGEYATSAETLRRAIGDAP